MPPSPSRTQRRPVRCAASASTTGSWKPARIKVPASPSRPTAPSTSPGSPTALHARACSTPGPIRSTEPSARRAPCPRPTATRRGPICSPTARRCVSRGRRSTLRATRAGQATVVHCWGLACGPCLVELPHWGKLQAEGSDLRLVLIAADPLPQEPERVAATLAQAGLGASESFSFTDRFHERLRYEIDPAWAGELPRTAMIDGDG